MHGFIWVVIVVVYMKITPSPVFGIVFVSQTTNQPSMFYITYGSLYFKNIQVIWMNRKQKDSFWNIHTMWKSLWYSIHTLSLKSFHIVFSGIYRNGFLS